ncbi:amidohydrolase family protein [Psychrobacillus sp. NEAU-3TGS]|uniref:amidohydrolase family protein n=1 Tax=Psychrobacillus sp. NEAU-3TGS TaxID=2995412 RepID=UPI0024985C6A|nr:amidohydrolase family protein [Psychrobacillus sp. NEAU-3TGS]MDI2587619.1 amidohydrolase family protein [Psychrobacillus sp. NEAU-3TGS]
MIIFNHAYVLNPTSNEFEKKKLVMKNQYIHAILDCNTTIEQENLYQNIDASTLYITPGLIDACSQIGLKETGIRWEGNDSYEPTQETNTILSVVDGIYPFDPSFKLAISTGVTSAHIMSTAENVVGAYSAIIHMDGATVDEMLITNNVGLSFSMGDVPKKAFFDFTKKPLTRMGIANIIRQTIQKLRVDGLPLDFPFFIRCHRADDIETALRIQKELQANFTLVHATEFALIDTDAKKEISQVIAGPVFQAIERFELKNLHPSLFNQLQTTDTLSCNATDHPISSVSHLKLESSLAIREGVSRNNALRSLTTDAAKILQIDHLTGSITTGLYADIVVWDQHPLNLTAKVLSTFIKGKEVYKGSDWK